MFPVCLIALIIYILIINVIHICPCPFFLSMKAHLSFLLTILVLVSIHPIKSKLIYYYKAVVLLMTRIP